MAIIDLKHLVPQDCDTVLFIGADDGKEYKLPVRKTVGMVLILQQYISEAERSKTSDDFGVFETLRLKLFMLTAWVKGYYPDVDIDWIKRNIVLEELFIKLVEIADNIFFPKNPEAPMPQKKEIKSPK